MKKLGKELLIFDGAMGTMLQSAGLETGELPETYNIRHPDIVLSIHKSYLDAGCNIIKTNTFGANPFKFPGNGTASANEVVARGVDLALNAVEQAGGNAYVALDIGPLGKLLAPMGNLPFEEAYKAFSDMASSGERAGADFALIETMSDTYEIKAAVLAVKENTSLPIVVTMAFDEHGKLLTGGDIHAAVALLEGLGADAVGLNCGLGPCQMIKLLPELLSVCSLPVVVNPNAGLPTVKNGITEFELGADEFAVYMKEAVRLGASVIGGCCGTTPEHIRKTAELCSGMKPLPVIKKGITVVSSYAHAVTFGKKPIIIGERINPTGKSRFKQALRENDIDYILKEGISEEENGADILDVNVGIPEIDEPSVLCSAVEGLQAVTALPLQIDTTSITAMERALRAYNGKAMINSVNGKAESMDAVFPLVLKYGGVAVCLTLDENGIPDTAEGRIKIAEKIIKRAREYGIDRKNLIIDTLVMTVSTGEENGNVTLYALEAVRNKIKLNTVLGVSNISFGLPQREKITAAFFTLALGRGLSAGIVNPLSETLMDAYYTYIALSGKDDRCLAYINRFSDKSNDGTKASAAQNSDMTLYDAVVKGMGELAAKATEKLLGSGAKSEMDIINGELIPALDSVGKGFEEHRVFLPQLLMSAEAASKAFDAIKNSLTAKGTQSEKRGRIVLATVKGDIHDIGKNIVRVLLENYGFEVIDLGKDVSPETIVEAVLSGNIRLVGLSALMTTTVVNMDKTVKLLRSAAPECRIMVGGAVLTKEYAEMIGADFYGKDAMSSVRYACMLSDNKLI